MLYLDFNTHRSALENQFESPCWITDSGMPLDQLEEQVKCLEQEDLPKAIIKANSFDLIARCSRIAVDREDIFQDKLEAVGILRRQRVRWQKQVQQQYFPEEAERMERAWTQLGAYRGNPDFSHTSPNTRLMLQVGLPGLLERVETASARPGLSGHQRDFYSSCSIALKALMTIARRLAAAVEPYNKENSDALLAIVQDRPRNIYQALQLLVLYFFVHNFVCGTRVRTLGRLDVLLEPFYRADLENGTFTKDEIREMFKFFLHKFWTAKVPYDLPFCLSGMDSDGNEVTSELSWLIVDTYDELNIYSPKIHIRVSDKTPKDFLKRVLSCVRGGNSSFVFVNDAVAIKGLVNVGIDPKDAVDYVPIGCYEPAVWGVEMGCTGNGGVNIAKALEFVFNNGVDLATGAQFGVQTGSIETYGQFMEALKTQIAHMTGKATDYVVNFERYYGQINPDPLLSCQYDYSVESGVDVYEGGAEYNNSSMYFYSLASFTDSVRAVKRLVFDEKRFTFTQLTQMLKANWVGYERERAMALRLPDKYGNDHPETDALAVEIGHFCADLVNNKPNGRGGVFKASMFTIDNCFRVGKKTMATPDGRKAGEPLSKNMCAVTGMDKNGITALIRTVTKFDHSRFPNGSVLDYVLHPSAVAGEDGLEAFYGLLSTYFRLGGLAMHGNVFHAENLRRAQQEPEKYKNLQVRVCGWNAYFVDLSREEQDAFIKQAENNE